jgi:hypothetical protein
LEKILSQAQNRIALGRQINDNHAANFHTMKQKSEPKKNNESQLLDLLKKVLPKATHDPKLAGQIYQAVEAELKAKSRASAFDKFCNKVELPDLEAKTLDGVKIQFKASFGDGDVTLKPNRKEKSLAVEVALLDGSQFSGEIKVRPVAAEGEEDPEFKPKFVPFPVSLPGDQELVWLLAKTENLTAGEAGMALSKVEDDRAETPARPRRAQLSGVHLPRSRRHAQRSRTEAALQDARAGQGAEGTGQALSRADDSRVESPEAGLRQSPFRSTS